MALLAAWFLAGCGVTLVFVGGFFLLLRLPLMAEDARYMCDTIENIDRNIPRLVTWLRRALLSSPWHRR